MTNDKLTGKAREIVGAGKEKLGEMTGDEQLQAEGRAQKAEGEVQNVVGRVKEKAKDLKTKIS